MPDPKIVRALEEAASALAALRASDETLIQIERAAEVISQALLAGAKVISCGNGGSMCDAMHFAEELTGRYRSDRRALAAIAISDPSHLTCTANDFGFESVFSRYVEAHGKQGDALLAISTSGTSNNILNAARVAKLKGMTVAALTGRHGSPLEELSDVTIATPGGEFSDRVQELHIKVIHILVELIEDRVLRS